MQTELDAHLRAQTRRARDTVVLQAPVPVAEIPTPALVLDLDALERNLDHMADFLARRGVGLRPHAKMHKCPEVAKRQLERGAVGICTAKLAEAEVMAAAGIDRILITSPVVTAGAVCRLVELVAAGHEVWSVVDDAAVVSRIGAAASAAGIELTVIVDLDPDMGRTGIARGGPALKLVRHIARTPGVRFGGLQQYSGQLQHLQGHDERIDGARLALAAGRETAALIEAAGHPVAVFTGGGTGTHDIDSRPLENGAGFTDLQCGSYAFMDEEYAALHFGNAQRFEVFEPALTVHVTAVSRPRAGAITVDGGIKTFASDTSRPVALTAEGAHLSGVRYHFGGDEHGILSLREGAPDLAVGDRLRFMTSHCDPTVNLHDWIYAARGGNVMELWPVAARGCGW
ncbi:MAG: DSD1 family PLP-dependent enzyme [Pseudomonadales bacterium]|nr:DSD1 family PLP-dependent enzyme [Pseudomonadales bacterium]